MFDKYMVVENTLQNVRTGDEVTGYRVDLRLPYYRGLELSAITVKLTVDGEEIDPTAAVLTVHGNSYPLERLSEISDDRWPFTEAATITVDREGGLDPAVAHEITAYAHVRLAYHGAGFEGRNTKQLRVAEAAA